MSRLDSAVVAACLLLSACATNQTPAQAAASLVTAVHKSCAAAQPFIDQAPTIYATLTPADQAALPLADITKATDAFGKVCSAGTLEPLTVASVSKTVFPVLVKLVDASHLPPEQKAASALALLIAQGALNAALAQ